MSFNIVEPDEFLCEKDHYLIDGKKYWRVTQVKNVIKNAGLVAWQVSVGKKKSNEIMKKRADFGTRMHKLFQLILNNKKVKAKNYEKETQDTLRLFDEFLDEHDVQPELIEQHLWSYMFGCAGTADFIGYLDKKLMIGDWKSSKDIYPEYWLQLAAYMVMFEELTGKKPDGCFILQIRDNKKKLEIKTYDEMRKEFDVFMACLKIFLWMKT